MPTKGRSAGLAGAAGSAGAAAASAGAAASAAAAASAGAAGTAASAGAAGTAAAPDYDAPETLVVSAPEQFKALADGVRTAIVSLLRERAYSTHQVAAALGIPKGTAGHHLKVLEHAGLIHVVRTRQVRAVTEKFYGRTARLFIFRADDPADVGALGATTLRQAAAELERSPVDAGFGLVKAHLAPKDARRLERRLEKLLDDLRAADDPTGEPWALAAAFYRRAGSA